MATPVDVLTGLTLDRLKRALEYDPLTGIFRWSATAKRKKVKAGSVAGCIRQDGSWQIRLDGHLYRAHRLAWFYMTGSWPVEEVDHVNRVGSDNRWVNLREASRVQNEINKILSNETGFSNVQSSNRRYRAKGRINGQTKHFGMADTPEEAHAIAVTERRKIYGDFVVSQIGEL